MTVITQRHIGRDRIITGGKHTTFIDSSEPYENSITVFGILATDIIIANVESIAPGGAKASGTLDIVGAIMDVEAAESGTELNSVEFQVFDGGEEPLQVEDWNILVADSAGNIAIVLKYKSGADPLPMVDLVLVLNAQVSGTYGATSFVFSDPDELLPQLVFANGAGDLAIGGSGLVELTGGTSTSVCTLAKTTPSAEQITFTFGEAVQVGNVVSYLVFGTRT